MSDLVKLPLWATNNARILQEHYATEESDCGLRSSHGPLVELALSGVGGQKGSRSYEGGINDRRHGWGGDHGPGVVSRHLRIHRALKTLETRHREALWLAHGPHMWPPTARTALGAYPGVCLLSETALRHWQREVDSRAVMPPSEAPEPRRGKRFVFWLPASVVASYRRARAGKAFCVGEWLRSGWDKKIGPTIIAEASQLLLEAHTAFDAAHAKLGKRRDGLPRGKRPPRVYVHHAPLQPRLPSEDTNA